MTDDSLNSTNPRLLRDGRLAANIFGTGDPVYTRVPKVKFLFFVLFYVKSIQSVISTLSSSGAGISTSFTNTVLPTADYFSNLGFAAKTVDRPKIRFENEVLNQYNKKRIVQKKHNFEPIQMTFHDTVDNKIYNMFQLYYRYYYGDIWNPDSSSWMNDIVSNRYQYGSNTTNNGWGWGYSPPYKTNAQSTYFFDRIEIYQLFGNKYDLITLVNPKIESFSPDNVDYSAGNGINEISMSFQYEGIILNNQQTPLSSGLASIMGFNLGDFLDTPASNISYTSSPNIISNALNDINFNIPPSKYNLITNSYNPTNFNLGGLFNGNYSSSSNNTGNINDFGDRNNPLNIQARNIG